MKLKRSWLFVLTVMVMVGVGSFAYAQQQTATISSSVAQVDKGGTFNVSVEYNVTPSNDGVKKFGTKICYDSSLVEFNKTFTTNFKNDLMNFDALGTEEPLQSDECGYGASGKVVVPFFFKSDGIFKDATFPVEIINLTFNALSTNGLAKINSLNGNPHSGFEYVGNEISVQVGQASTDFNLTLNITGNAGNTVTVDGGNAYATSDIPVTLTYAPNSVVTLTAALAATDMVEWTGVDAGATATEAKVTMDADKTVTVKFATAPSCTAVILTKPETVELGTSEWTAEVVEGAGYYWEFFSIENGVETNTGKTITESQGTVVFAATTGPMKVKLTVTCGTEKSYAEHFFTITDPNVNQAPVATDSGPFEVKQGKTYNGQAVASDPDGDTLTYTRQTFPAHSSAFTFDPDGSFSYTAAADYDGPDSFEFKVCDPDNACDTATVSITVKPSGGVEPDGDISVPADGADIFDALVAAMYSVCGDNAQCKADLETKYPGLVAHLDVYNTGDGVTIMDALAIAKYDVGLTCDCALDKLTK